MRKSLLALMLLLGSVTGAKAETGGVQLGNQFVPKEKFIVFLMIGHCNMMGQAKYPENGAYHPRAWRLDLQQRPPRWVPATARNGKRGAPTLPFLQALAEQYPDYHFGVINNATSGARVHVNYRRGKSNYTQIVRTARRIKPHVTLAGVVTMLGYMEGRSLAQTRQFPYQFASMTREMRADLSEPDLPFFITQYEIGAARKGPGWMKIDRALREMPRHVGNARVISMANLTYDTNHNPSYRSLKIWAGRAAQAVDTLAAARWQTSSHGWQVANASPVIIEAPAAVPAEEIATPSPVIAEVEAILVKASKAPNPRQISPYKEAVATAQYEVKQVLKGKLDAQRVLAMQMVIEKGQMLPTAHLKTGATYRLKLGSWSSLPRYHTYPVSDDIMDFESQVFFVHSIEPMPGT